MSTTLGFPSPSHGRTIQATFCGRRVALGSLLKQRLILLG